MVRSVLPDPLNIFFARARVDDEQKIVFAEAMNDHVVYERTLRIKHRGVMRLADDEFRGVVHRNMLNGRESAAGSLVRVNTNVAHVADVKNANAPAHGFMLGHETAARRVLNGHIPAAKIDHFRAKLPVQRVEGRLAKFNFGRRCDGVHSVWSGRKLIVARARKCVKEGPFCARVHEKLYLADYVSDYFTSSGCQCRRSQHHQDGRIAGAIRVAKVKGRAELRAERKCCIPYGRNGLSEAGQAHSSRN